MDTAPDDKPPLPQSLGATAGTVGTAPLPPLPPLVRSEQLFGRGTELRIEHRGAIYRLRQTALGKLILTK
jgi:hemin uptake protein HemP